MAENICPKELCTGCSACFNICPKKCIKMVEDVEGFLFPNIDLNQCDDCGACKRVCPINNLEQPNHLVEPQVYACWNKDEEVRFQSASGGVFSALANYILDNDGVVFGAAYNDEMKVEHIGVTRKEELDRLRSSKYAQSDIGYSYVKVQHLLRQNKKVLFSGTPCQVAALHAFLGKDYENLLTCDILCKGVPSPGLFDKYVKYLETRYRARVTSINFRHKCKDWRLASTMVFFIDGQKYILENLDNSFMYAFANSFSLRSACYQCPYTNIERNGDVTLGDFWGIGEVINFHHNIRKGVSLIIVNSQKGFKCFKESSDQFCFEKRSLDEAVNGQGISLSHPVIEPKNRQEFFDDYQRLEYQELAQKHLVDKGLKGFIKRVIPRTWIFHVRKNIRKIWR